MRPTDSPSTVDSTGKARAARVWPSRSISSVIGRPTLARVSLITRWTPTSGSADGGMSIPLMARMTSPERSPILAAGDGSPSSVASMALIPGRKLVGSPMTTNRIAPNRMAMKKWVTGPVTITMARCQMGLA
jgi:hypothetical protein